MQSGGRRFVAAVATVAAVLVAAGTTPVRAQDLKALDRQFQDDMAARRPPEAEKVARQALRALAGSTDTNTVNYWTSALGQALAAQGRFDEAATLHKQVLDSDERLFGPDDPVVGSDLSILADTACRKGRYDEAAPLFERALRIFEKTPGRGERDAIQTLLKLADLNTQRHRYADAEAFFARTSEAIEKANLPEGHEAARVFSGRGYVAQELGRYAEAEALYRRALAVLERTLGPDHHDLGMCLEQIATACGLQRRYAEATAAATRALAIAEQSHGAEHVHVAQSLNRLGDVYVNQARFAEAESLHKRALAIKEKLLGPDDHEQAISLRPLAVLFRLQGRFAEAEALLKRALQIEEKFHGPDNPDVHGVLVELAEVYSSQGKYSDAEPLIQRALASVERVYGADHPEVSQILSGLAGIYAEQGRFEEAEGLFRRALASAEKGDGPDSPATGGLLNDLAAVLVERGRYDEAEALCRRGLAILEKALLPDTPDLNGDMAILAKIAFRRGRYDEAEQIYQRVLAAVEKVAGRDNPAICPYARALARIAKARHRLEEAETWIDRAITVADRAGVSPGERYDSYLLRAEIAWDDGRRDEALADLRVALKLAEDQHRLASGAARERAASFAEFVSGYERMIEWQAEVGNASEAMDAVERSRARSLLEEMAAAGADLQLGRTPAERAELERRGAELREQIARLEKTLDAAERATPRDEAAVARHRAELAEARERFYQHGRDADAGSEVHRGLLKRESGPPRVSQLRRRLCPEGILLAYLFGAEGGYVVAIAPGRTVVKALRIDDEAARDLGVAPGALTDERLKAVLLGNGGDGVVPGLADPKSANLAPKLAALWRVLVPEDERRALTDGTAKRLIVAPDGPLAFLPFEALVVDDGRGPEPRYLLDAGPPIVYGPSASVLLSLADRPVLPPTRLPVLALGDPAYPGGGPGATVDRGSTSSKARYRISGGTLNRLPFSAWEADWIVRAFTDAGLGAEGLTGAAATESAFRAGAKGRKVLHFAGHGLADQELGNFYGALALTPGPGGDTDPNDDGFLTLPEIYGLDLKGCELVILSACQTNFGPQQRGEGTWALSRGFLIAGARRVIASNWLVDDEAAASLMSVNCTLLARIKARQEGGEDAYARSLHEAKRWVRKQDKWKAPYYWASLVLVGPP